MGPAEELSLARSYVEEGNLMLCKAIGGSQQAHSYKKHVKLHQCKDKPSNKPPYKCIQSLIWLKPPLLLKSQTNKTNMSVSKIIVMGHVSSLS